MLHRLALLLEPCQHTPKHFEYDQIKTKIFGLKDKAMKPLKREKGENHKIAIIQMFFENSKTPFLVKFSHKDFPSF